MDTLQDLLGKYAPKEPDEIRRIKQYIQDEFQVLAKVALQGEDKIVITVPSASLANTLRFRIPQLQAAAETGKRLLLRIG
jgi:hypothetical protein